MIKVEILPNFEPTLAIGVEMHMVFMIAIMDDFVIGIYLPHVLLPNLGLTIADDVRIKFTHYNGLSREIGARSKHSKGGYQYRAVLSILHDALLLL